MMITYYRGAQAIVEFKTTGMNNVVKTTKELKQITIEEVINGSNTKEVPRKK